ncbi:MAG: D-hexose-6-phosphate mutarotase [Gammaproteobacteria bacterium]|nr:D-hexose-6-phosphate mutarotase [Gammaproteobacteria bacterium]MCB1924009.1 D-hexose-6-phosphate mutarotase [Gammaproteobacteria bacterium]
MPVDRLNATFAIPGVAEFTAGPGGLPQLHVSNQAANARISIYGGQVLSYTPRTADADLLYLSTKAHYAPGKAIKGGVPICWPWFGAHPTDSSRPAHGFARNMPWVVYAVTDRSPSCTRVALRLTDTADTQSLWPHRFILELELDIGVELAMTLTTHNAGNAPFTITQALHTYFATASIDATRVTGLDGHRYLDKTQGFSEQLQDGDVRFDSEVDRIYQGVSSPLQIHDDARGRVVHIQAQNSRTAVVWNPWREIGAAMSDLDDEAYRRFVCVETANAADDVIEVGAGDSFSLCARYRITP